MNKEVLTAIAPDLPVTIIVLILEHIAISKSFGRINNYVINPSQELVAVGFTNLIGPFLVRFESLTTLIIILMHSGGLPSYRIVLAHGDQIEGRCPHASSWNLHCRYRSACSLRTDCSLLLHSQCRSVRSHHPCSR